MLSMRVRQQGARHGRLIILRVYRMCEFVCMCVRTRWCSVPACLLLPSPLAHDRSWVHACVAAVGRSVRLCFCQRSWCTLIPAARWKTTCCGRYGPGGRGSSTAPSSVVSRLGVFPKQSWRIDGMEGRTDGRTDRRTDGWMEHEGGPGQLKLRVGGGEGRAHAHPAAHVWERRRSPRYCAWRATTTAKPSSTAWWEGG